MPRRHTNGAASVMRASMLVLPALLIALTGCICRNSAQRGSDDAILSRKLVGEWEGALSIYNPRSKSNETFSFVNKINSDGTFSTTNRIYDSSGHFVKTMGWGGTFVVSNGAVVCIITHSSEKQHLSPPKIEVEPIVRLDANEMEIINGSGLRIASKRVVPQMGEGPKERK